MHFNKPAKFNSPQLASIILGEEKTTKLSAGEERVHAV